MNEIINTINLTKTYGKTKAVNNINLSVKEGEIFGFIGLNGAGKTTAIRMLLGMISPTSGECYLQGEKVNAGNTNTWNNVGYIVETPYSYPELTVRDNLEIVRKLRGVKDKDSVNWIIKKLKLEKYESKKVKHLSLGNAQRLGIAKAIMHKPKILLLDEPTNGLDPAGIVEVLKLLMDLAKNSGVTILVSSHKLNEISRIATNIAIIHEGELIKKVDKEELQYELKKSLIIDGKDKKEMKLILSKAGYEADIIPIENLNKKLPVLQIHNADVVNNPEKIVTLLVNNGYPPRMVKVQKEDLEEYFLRSIEEFGGDVNE